MHRYEWPRGAYLKARRASFVTIDFESGFILTISISRVILKITEQEISFLNLEMIDDSFNFIIF